MEFSFRSVIEHIELLFSISKSSPFDNLCLFLNYHPFHVNTPNISSLPFTGIFFLIGISVLSESVSLSFPAHRGNHHIPLLWASSSVFEAKNAITSLRPGSCDHTPVTLLSLLLLRTPVITLGPLRQSRIIFLFLRSADKKPQFHLQI